jgi:hypothetical protein
MFRLLSPSLLMHLSHLSKSSKIFRPSRKWALVFATNYKDPFPVPQICEVSDVPSVAAVSFSF